MFRLTVLALLAARVFATPITYTFEGTWDHVTPSAIDGVALNVGDWFTGSFTFERLSGQPGNVVGELTLSLGPLIFEPESFGELNQAGSGIGAIFMSGRTKESACRFGSSPYFTCEAQVVFQERQGGNFAVIAGAHSNNITLDRDLFPIPEPSTIVLLGSALAILWHASRRKRLHPHHRP